MAQLFLRFVQKGWHCFPRAPTLSEGCLSLAFLFYGWHRESLPGITLAILRLAHPPGYSYHLRDSKYSSDIKVGLGKSHFKSVRTYPAPFDEPNPKGMRHPEAFQRVKGCPPAFVPRTAALSFFILPLTKLIHLSKFSDK